jgi:hypothetical protein
MWPIAAGALIAKIYERRAILLGLDPLTGHAVMVISPSGENFFAPPAKQSRPSMAGAADQAALPPSCTKQE